MPSVFYFFTFSNNCALGSALKIIFMGASLQKKPLEIWCQANYNREIRT